MSIKAQHMSVSKQEEFIVWLDGELSKRGWSDYQLAKRAQISHSVISRARSGSLPKWDACESIASALGLPIEFVFRKAGLLPPKPESNPKLEEVSYLFSQLTPDEQDELTVLARFKIERRGRKERDG
jgi:transcriptional regulator with XRE-family HTH domain